MNISRRKFLLLIWFVSVIGAGFAVCKTSGISEYGWATSLSLLAISLGVPLMRAFTEFSK
jgi:hypothetical protein